MVTFLLIAAAVIFVILGIGAYYRQKSAPDDSDPGLPRWPNVRGLFSHNLATTEEGEKQPVIDAGRSESVIQRAQNSDRSALVDAHNTGDTSLYNRALIEFVQRADSEVKLVALMSYITQHELPVSEDLAHAVIGAWRRAPNRNGTAKALHFAALTDNADLYGEAVESALNLWREGKINDLSPIELRALFDGEFWVLSSRTRSSGAGFVLKQILADARRELEAATRVTPRG